MAKAKRAAFEIGGETIVAGERRTVHLPVAQLYTDEPVLMPVHVVHGSRDGPTLFVCAAIHGDELNGIEIVRRLLAWKGLTRLRGTLLAIPIVNVLGVVHKSRNLPDRRDLNRSFPGSEHGSLAARIADRFMTEVVQRSTHGIDLHTAAIHRSNLPQIRATLDDPLLAELAAAFGAPVVLDSGLRAGSLRETAAANGVKTLLYEAGEALRFDETCIRVGVRGVIRVMRRLQMARASRAAATPAPLTALGSRWVRAGASGIVRPDVRLGQVVTTEQRLGVIANTLGEQQYILRSPTDGVVVGQATLPLLHEGEAVFHIATFARSETLPEPDTIINETGLHDYDLPYDGPPVD